MTGVGFLRIRGHLKAVSKERNIIAHNLVALRGTKNLSEAVESNRFLSRLFVSHADGEQDKYALILPQFQPGKTDYVLIVYLHGMGSNFLEPFVCPPQLPIADGIQESYPQIGILSCGYRKDSWGNDKAISDINQNIREVMQEFPVKSIVIMGTSMGGCTALAYAVNAPPDVKQKITGVVSVESAGDLIALYKKTTYEPIKWSMANAFGGIPEAIPQVYQAKSFVYHISELPPALRVAVISAKSDKIVPSEFQREIVDKLSESGFQAKLIEIDGGHGAPPASEYVHALQYVLSR